jgi:hypothetical protein
MKAIDTTRYFIEQQTEPSLYWRQRSLLSIVQYRNDPPIDLAMIDDRREDHANKVFAYVCKTWPEINFRLVKEHIIMEKTVLKAGCR